MVLGFALLVFGLAAETTVLSRVLSARPVLLGGGISYSVYLMQMPVKAWVNMAADRFAVGNAMLRLACTFTLLTLISLILFQAVENPARKLLRTLFARLEERRSGNAIADRRRRATP